MRNPEAEWKIKEQLGEMPAPGTFLDVHEFKRTYEFRYDRIV